MTLRFLRALWRRLRPCRDAPDVEARLLRVRGMARPVVVYTFRPGGLDR